jgi:hypothetical protein
LISVRSEVQILPGPPPTFAQQNVGTRQRLRLQPRERHRAEKGSWFRAPAAAIAVAAQPLTPRSDFGLRPKPRGCSSVGRAPALQAGGHRFDSVHLHHWLLRSKMSGRVSGCAATARAPRERRKASFVASRVSGALAPRERQRAATVRGLRIRRRSIGNDVFAHGCELMGV